MKRIKASLNDRAHQRLIKQKQLDGFKDKSLGEWLTWKHQEEEITPGLSAEIRKDTIVRWWCGSCSGKLSTLKWVLVWWFTGCHKYSTRRIERVRSSHVCLYFFV